MDILELWHHVALAVVVTLGIMRNIMAMSVRELLAVLRRPAA